MGHVRVPVRISHPEKRDYAIHYPEALIDTGATWTTIPRAFAEELGLTIEGKMVMRTPEGQLELDKSYAHLELEGRELTTNILVSDTLQIVLIGVTTLESLGLAVDPRSETLRDSDLFLL